jgi:hypothetical protein
MLQLSLAALGGSPADFDALVEGLSNRQAPKVSVGVAYYFEIDAAPAGSISVEPATRS